MRSVVADALELIRETTSLLEEEATILGSPEDTNYFRKTYIKSQNARGPKKSIFFGERECRMQNSESVPTSSSEPPKTSSFLLPTSDFPKSPPPETSDFCTQTSDLFKSLFAKIAPELPLLNEIPSDAFAKKIATRWKTKNQTAPISILSFSEPPPQKAFLEAIAKALDVYFGPAKIVAAEAIEKEKQWDAFLSAPDLKLIIACDYTLWQLNSLMSFYREDPRKLGNISLFLLPDLSLYLKDPLLKRSLWKALCQKINT